MIGGMKAEWGKRTEFWREGNHRCLRGRLRYGQGSGLGRSLLDLGIGMIGTGRLLGLGGESL